MNHTFDDVYFEYTFNAFNATLRETEFTLGEHFCISCDVTNICENFKPCPSCAVNQR